MMTRSINAANAHDLNSQYSQAIEVSGQKRTVYVSGQIPVRPDGTTPETFTEQAKQTWANVEAQLRAADMGLENIVKHTTFLASRQFRAQNTAVRQEVLGDQKPALTVIVTGIFDEGWLLEIEAIAVG